MILIAVSGFCFGSTNVPRRSFNERGKGSKFKLGNIHFLCNAAQSATIPKTKRIVMNIQNLSGYQQAEFLFHEVSSFHLR